MNNVANVKWDDVLNITNAELAINMFCKLFLATCDKHAPVVDYQWNLWGPCACMII